MSFGSLVLLSRFLSLNTRMLRPYLMQLAFVVIIFIVMAFNHLISLTGIVGAPGLNFFRSIVWFDFVAICMMGISYFATAISEEKDENMLGLLKMAGIGPLALLLGKSTTRLILCLTILVLQIPFTLLAITLGGVTVSQVLGAYVALGAFLILVANVGVLCSVRARSSGWASAFVTLVLIVYLAGIPLLKETIDNLILDGAWSPSDQWVALVDQLSEWLWSASILNQLQAVFVTVAGESSASGITAARWVFIEHAQLTSSLAVALACFALAWLMFERWTDDRSSAVSLWQRLLGGKKQKAGRKPIRVWRFPVAWKDFHFIAGGRQWLLLKCVAYTCLFAAVVIFVAWDNKFVLSNVDGGVICGAVMWFAMVGAAVELAIHASNMFREEVRQQTLPLLMLLPIPSWKIWYAKLGGCILSIFPAFACFVLAVVISPAETILKVLDGLFEPFFWVTVAVYILFLHVTALMSVLVKWGALPLSIFIVYVFSSCVMSPVTMIFVILSSNVGGSEYWLGIWVVICLAACVPIQIFLYQRLESLASR